MKAICISNTYKKIRGKKLLTIGKVYNVKLNAYRGDAPYPGYQPTYILKSDLGNIIYVPKYYFKLIDEYRQEQIEKILE